MTTGSKAMMSATILTAVIAGVIVLDVPERLINIRQPRSESQPVASERSDSQPIYVASSSSDKFHHQIIGLYGLISTSEESMTME